MIPSASQEVNFVTQQSNCNKLSWIDIIIIYKLGDVVNRGYMYMNLLIQYNFILLNVIYLQLRFLWPTAVLSSQTTIQQTRSLDHPKPGGFKRESAQQELLTKDRAMFVSNNIIVGLPELGHPKKTYDQSEHYLRTKDGIFSHWINIWQNGKPNRSVSYGCWNE